MTQPITVGDDEQRRHLDDADALPLLPAVAHATGDLSLLRSDLAPDPALIQFDQGGLSADQQAAIRKLAHEALVRFRDAGSVPAPPPTAATLRRLMEFAVGGVPMGDYVALLEEELGVEGRDLRAPRWHRSSLAPGRSVRVAVIGAGMSGLLAAHRLRQAGLDVVVFEKNDDVGGTWLENTYPGCRVDNPNHLYSYSFAQRDDWPDQFSPRSALFDYFSSVADRLELRPCIRFGVAVASCRFHDERHLWTVEVVDGAGAQEELEFDVVISAVGQLNRPSIPPIPGQERFAGPAFHSAAWRHDVDLAGRRVAVVGTGASAVQFVPEIAAVAAEVTVFQRTPNWLAPTPNYHEPVPDGLRWLYRHVPHYSGWHRFTLFWRTGDGVLPSVTVDPSWSAPGSLSRPNAEFRGMLERYLRSQFAGRPDLLERALPDYPVGAKRILRDNGAWARTLRQPHVHLVTDPIESFDVDGVRTADGSEHGADVVVYGTGFEASRFLMPMQVTGRDGVDLHEQWDGEPRAYLGVTVPRFPNLFLLYGPNTNVVINGSTIFFSECEVRYVTACLEELLRRGSAAMDCRRDVHDAYNAEIDAANAAMAWGAVDVHSWYKSASGRVSQNWPLTLLEFWERTRRVEPADYEWLGS